MNKTLQKREAIERMQLLQIYKNTIKEFDEENIVNKSESGFLYWLTDEEKEYVTEFENEYNALVYHVIKNYTQIGTLLTFLYVSDSEEEWEYDRDDLKYGYACAYVKNLEDEHCSEFGSVCIKPQFGGLIRTA